MKIGDRIKQRRIELGLSVDDLANKLNKNRATIYRYESNDIENFPTTVLEPLAQALQTSPGYLMGWENEWDKEAEKFEAKINAFYYQLKSIGWKYEWLEKEKLYLLSNGTASIKITSEEYSTLVEQSEDFCRRQLQKLLLKSSSLLNAAHDSGATEKQRNNVEKIMDDDNEWE